MAPDPFDALNLDARFDLDAASIQRAWLRKSAALHPDRVSPAPGAGIGSGADGGASAEGDAARVAAVINDAKRVLEDPERRAEALLTRLGGPAKEADKSLPPGLLMEFLEVRESMEAVWASGKRLDEFHAWADERRAGHITRVAGLFAGALRAADAPDTGTLRAIRLELNAWRYVERMIEQLDPDYHPSSHDGV